MEPDFLTEYERAEHYKRLYQSRGDAVDFLFNSWHCYTFWACEVVDLTSKAFASVESS
jgi:hypothetical protein